MSLDDPWPRKGDVLFEEGDDWWHNACVGWSSQDWSVFAEGYKQGTDMLVQYVVDTKSKQDFLVYPIIFLYRHALEIALKYVLDQGFQLLGQQQKLPNVHPLFPLWQQCRQILEKVWPNGPKEDLDAVGDVINQFDKKDPKSMTFRYPVDTAGNASHPISERINLRNVAEVVSRAYSLLQASGSGISVFLENKRDMERDSAT